MNAFSLALLLGFEIESTGGNCEALVARFGDGELTLASNEHSVPVEGEECCWMWGNAEERQYEESYGCTFDRALVLSCFLQAFPKRRDQLQPDSERRLICATAHAVHWPALLKEMTARHEALFPPRVTLGDVRRATHAARAVNPLIGVTVNAGRFTVVECSDLPSGSSSVVPLAGPFSAADAVAFLQEVAS